MRSSDTGRAVRAARLSRIDEMARICWIRSSRFPPLAPIRRDHPAGRFEGLRRRILIYWFAVVLWPLYVMVLIPQIPHIRTLGPASATVTPIRPTDHRRSPRLAVVAASIGGLYVIALFGITQVAALGTAPCRIVAMTILVLGVVVPFAAVAIAERGKRREDPAGVRRHRALADWCAELAGPDVNGYVLTDVATAKDGTGTAVQLINALNTEWAATGAVVTLYAATDDLTAYYSRLGAKRTTLNDRRMYFDSRTDFGGTPTAAES